MSTNPNSGLSGYDNTSATHNTADNQPGVVDKVLSYIPGLSPTASRDQTSGTTDATSEPAFGAAVGPGSSHTHTGTGSSGFGSSSGVGAGSDTFGSTNTSGPHGSNLANQADPRVDSDNSRLGHSSTSGLGSSHTGTGALGSSSTGYASSTTSGPHDSNLANKADPRVDSDNSRLGHSSTSGLGSSHTGTGALGSSSTGYGSSTTSGPHDSNLANKADPRVDSDNSRLGSTHTSGLGSSHTGTGSSLGDSGRDSYVPAPTLNPHDEERARVVADRAVGSTGTGVGSGAGLGSGIGHEHSRGSGVGSDTGLVSSTGNEHIPGVAGSGVGHQHGHEYSHGSGVGSGVGLGSGAALGGAAVGSGLGHESSRGSGVGSGVGLGHDSSRGSGVGLGHDSSRGSGVGSGVGLDSTRESGVGLGSTSHGASTTSGPHDSDLANKADPRVDSDNSRAGRDSLTGDHSSESTTHHHTEGGHGHSHGSSSKRENKDAIPTAGGIKLGEKHWGESDIVPADPKPRNENISSSSGQPDR